MNINGDFQICISVPLKKPCKWKNLVYVGTRFALAHLNIWSRVCIKKCLELAPVLSLFFYEQPRHKTHHKHPRHKLC